MHFLSRLDTHHVPFKGSKEYQRRTWKIEQQFGPPHSRLCKHLKALDSFWPRLEDASTTFLSEVIASVSREAGYELEGLPEGMSADRFPLLLMGEKEFRLTRWEGMKGRNCKVEEAVDSALLGKAQGFTIGVLKEFESDCRSFERGIGTMVGPLAFTG